MNNFADAMRSSKFTGALALTNDDLRRAAPSVFAATPWQGMKDRYKFIPTIEVIDVLRDKGFAPTSASQSRSRIEGKGDFTKHMIRFRSNELIHDLHAGQELPELVLVNSHDGTSAYKFMSGIFRLVCSNGMIVQSADFGGVNVRHTGGNDWHNKVIDATYEVMDDAPKTLAAISDYKQMALSPPERMAFAVAAHELKGNDTIQPAQLLSTRRHADASGDLWTTSNVVQENVIKGGLRGRSESGRRSTTRPVKSVGEDLRINRALWRLTEEMARLKS